MPRLSPRVNVNVPATIATSVSKDEVVIRKIGLNGCHFSFESSNPGRKLEAEAPMLLQYKIAGQENVEHSIKVVRTDKEGYCGSFPSLDLPTKRKLWEFIVQNLSDFNECPFCGVSLETKLTGCTHCKWELNFHVPDYFNYYEKNCKVIKIQEKLAGLTAEQIDKILYFIDIEIQKVAVSSEDQEFVGAGRTMLEVFANIRKVAPTNLTALILGESGTGKELTAQAIHDRSSRRDKPFVAINCAAIPDNLLEAELFGYEKGAFTGAHMSKKGKFEFADKGTIFLDEIGDMPINLQGKLLRFLQDKIVEKVGAIGGKKVDVRIIAATNRDLNTAITTGNFRSDLYYRLDEFSICLPPVRERGEDVVLLAKYFLNKFSRELGLIKTFTKDATDAIRVYDWPGNVREIINKVRRAMVMSSGHSITPDDLSLDLPKKETGEENSPLNDTLAQIEKEKIRKVLKDCSHNICSTAQALGISRPTLYRRMKIYGID